jgi:glutamate/aspartate transport system substrate-binding protein
MVRVGLLLVAAVLLALGASLPSAARADDLYGTLAKIKDSGRIAIGHRESSIPFSYLDDAGKPEGYAIDLCLRVVETIEAALGLVDLEVQMVPDTPATRIPLLLDGTIDLECGSTTSSLSREEQVDFSHIIFITGTKLLVKQGSGIAEIEDLEGRTVALSRGTTTEAVIKDLVAAKGLDLEILEVADHAEAFRALESGQVAAYASDLILLHGLISQARQPDSFAAVGRFLSYEPYALMMRRDDSAFRLVVDRTLSNLFRTREILDIYQKWFGPLGVPPSELLDAAFVLQALPE